MNITLPLKRQKHLAALIDILIITILVTLVYLISVYTNAHHIIDNWAANKRFAGLKFDELIVVFAFLGVAAGLFSMRRWRELDIEIARREQSEKELLASENKFKNLAERSLTGIYIVQDDKFRYVNPALADIFGYTVEELTEKMGPADVVFPDDLASVNENLKKRISGKIESINYCFRIVRKNKEVIYVEVYGSRTTYKDRPAVIGTLLDITERRSAEEHIKKQNLEIALRNQELSILYKVSSSINHTIDMYDLFPAILNTILEIDILKIERKGGILLFDGDRMNLVAHLGHPASFLELHRNITTKDCLCGLAARTGEIVISKNSHEDKYHTIAYPCMTPHGHIIIPLKVVNDVVGVLYLYLPVDFEVEDKTIQILETIGNQIGIAIKNSLLYEQTKSLSLHDPLTKVANRNLMNIELEKSFARSRRFGNPFSIIMLDLDDFKKYNDTHGHVAGDKLLIKTANIISKEIRGVDLVARYGGEEFLILLSGTEITDACFVAERVRNSIEAHTDITVSLGLASHSHRTEHIEDLIKMADAALYQAKQNGKNRVEVNS